MRVLRSGLNVEEWFAGLRGAASAALFLDYDGTLAPFHVRPEEAKPYPGVREAIDAIVAQGKTRVAVISGREIDEVKPLLGLSRPVEIWGAHGFERLGSDGRRHAATLPPEVAEDLTWLDGWMRELEPLGARLELKPASRAIHWRGRSSITANLIRARVDAHWRERRAGLQWHEFDGGIELRAPQFDKGRAVATILDELEPDSTFAFLGDDVTDEDAFNAIGTRGLSVLVRVKWRATAADVWIKPPGELLDFLARWKRARGGGR
jgi:trehalose-phosphatase